jgi:uncharacterized protein (TIGR00106 family)
MLVEFSVIPFGKGWHVGDEVAEVVRLIDESGLDYRLHAMGTTIEGSWDEVMPLLRKCHETLANRSDRVYTFIRIDDFKERSDALNQKVDSVEKRLGKQLKH